MASAINKIHGVLQEALLKPFDNSTVGQAAVGPATYLWRARILANRLTSLKAQRIVLPTEIDPAKKNINTGVSALQATKRRALLKVPKPKLKATPTVNTVKNQIIIINPNTNADGNGTYESIVIQGKPSEVNIESENHWVAVRTNGRNNPFYMYTGSEDTISFDISWYSTQPDRKDVIKKCRLLESWSKADAYAASPPELWISWGSAELFKDYSFILVSAPYVLSNFQNACRANRTSPITDLGLLPNAATQKLTFKRVTKHNLTTADIQRVHGNVPQPMPEEPIATQSKPKYPDKVEV